MSQTVTCFIFFFFNDTATTEIYTLSLHDALPIFGPEAIVSRSSPITSEIIRLISRAGRARRARPPPLMVERCLRSEERRVGKECRSRGSPYHEKKEEQVRGCEELPYYRLSSGIVH